VRIRTTSIAERVVLGAVLASWTVLLGAIIRHPLFVSHDSLSNNVHVWYISDRLWHGHALPLHMPMLAGGDALAYPYAFVPWTTAALAFPLLGDWALTLWLVIGFVAVVLAALWALPEVRRGWSLATILVNPALVMAALVGQIPFLWGAAMLFGAIGCWRRGHLRWTTALAGLAMATHPVVMIPLAGVLALVAWWTATDRRAAMRRLAACLAVGLVIAAPAVVMILASPAVTQSAGRFRVVQLIRIALTRGTVFAVPLLLAAIASTTRRWVLPLVAALLALPNAVALGPMNRFAWAAPFRSPDRSIDRLIASPAFARGATYRVLGFSDGRVSMYRLVRSGARLDGEFFPESQARRSFHDRATYERVLLDRHVDQVIAWWSYDTRWRTDEHRLLVQMADRPGCADGSLAAERVFVDPSYEVFAIGPCRPS
jgi:hypothetical protein